MEQTRTPVCKNGRFRRFLASDVVIPASPAMSQIGFGTGVNVYSLTRSPIGGQLRSPWAIKKLNKKLGDPEYETRLIAEADILRSLKHPNIVGFRAFVEDSDGRKCLAMEECETSLGELIENRSDAGIGPFTPKNIMTVANDICRALHYLHAECHILHGDLKSYNILIRGDFEVAKLCDFGVIVRLDMEGSALPGQKYIGTECWCAPEVLEDEERSATTKAELFSFGLTLWEMLALKPPHIPDDDTFRNDESDSSYSEERFPDIVGTSPELPIGLGPEYEEIVEIFNWCCESDPERRPTALVLLQFLQTLREK